MLAVLIECNNPEIKYHRPWSYETILYLFFRQIANLVFSVNQDEKTIPTNQINDDFKRKIEYLKEEFKAYEKELSTLKKDVAGELCTLCHGCVEICSALIACMKTLDEGTLKGLAAKIIDHNTKIISVVSKVDKTMKRAQLQSQSPFLVRLQ